MGFLDNVLNKSVPQGCLNLPTSTIAQSFPV